MTHHARATAEEALLGASRVKPVAVSEHTFQVVHTADLDQGALRAARALLDQVFGEGMTDDAWHHALGGMHALVWEAGQLVGHAAVVQRSLLHAGRALRTGYIEGVAVRADRRRRGYGAMMMSELERIIRHAYDLGALAASEMGAGFYAARGWKAWKGRTWAFTPDGLVRTADEDHDVFVYEVGTTLDLYGDLACDWRKGDIW